MVALLGAMIVITAGCQGMAKSEEPGSIRASKAENAAADWPLTFSQHNFGAHCFDTIGCRIDYAGFSHGARSDDEVSPPWSSYRGTREQLLRAGHIARRNFPPPAQVRWRSRDGTPHEAEVDIGGIFKDRVVLHNVPREEYREDLGIADPDIVLEVDDRTINVYMRAFIPTRTEQVVGTRRGFSRAELILAWTRTY